MILNWWNTAKDQKAEVGTWKERTLASHRQDDSNINFSLNPLYYTDGPLCIALCIDRAGSVVQVGIPSAGLTGARIISPSKTSPQSVFMWTRQHSGASTLYLYLHYLHLPLPLLCSVGCIISSSGPGPLWAGPRKHFPCELWPPKAQHLQLLQEEHRTMSCQDIPSLNLPFIVIFSVAGQFCTLSLFYQFINKQFKKNI